MTEMMDDYEIERSEFRVLGRKVGSASGWDDVTDHGIILYDFQPAPGVPIPPGDTVFEFESGVIEQSDESGVIWSKDMIEVLRDVPRPE